MIILLGLSTYDRYATIHRKKNLFPFLKFLQFIMTSEFFRLARNGLCFSFISILMLSYRLFGNTLQ